MYTRNDKNTYPKHISNQTHFSSSSDVTQRQFGREVNNCNRIKSMDIWLVVSTHLKILSQNGNLPQLGVKTKNI